MAEEIKLILSDIDGTILDNDHRPDSDLAEKIAELKTRKIPFVLASARSPLGMFPIAEQLNLGDNPLACYNGALVLKGTPDDFETMIEHRLNKNDVKRIVALIRCQFPHIAINLYSGKDWVVEDINKWVQIEADITKEKPVVKHLDLVLLDTLAPVHKLLLIAEPSEIAAFFAHAKELKFEDASFYLSKDNYLEVTSQSVSKENALLEVAKFYHIPLANIMTIGDNFNDLPMLKLAGLGVAMGNAPEAIKQEADATTLANVDKGVSRAIEKYVLK